MGLADEPKAWKSDEDGQHLKVTQGADVTDNRLHVEALQEKKQAVIVASTLKEILTQLRVLNAHMQLLTEENIKDDECFDDLI